MLARLDSRSSKGVGPRLNLVTPDNGMVAALETGTRHARQCFAPPGAPCEPRLLRREPGCPSSDGGERCSRRARGPRSAGSTYRSTRCDPNTPPEVTQLTIGTLNLWLHFSVAIVLATFGAAHGNCWGRTSGIEPSSVRASTEPHRRSRAPCCMHWPSGCRCLHRACCSCTSCSTRAQAASSHHRCHQ